MFKKLLAGLTTIVLSLGLVALTAAPASAHHNTIKAQVSCYTGPEGFWKVTWTVENSENREETITASNDASIVPVGTVIGARDTLTVVKYYASKPSSSFTLELSAEWSNGNTNTSEGTLDRRDFRDGCIPDDTTKKIEICHATGSTSNPYTSPEVAVDSIITNDPNGHGTHSGDIIPPFTYVKQGVPGSYPGKNWDAYGQAVFAAGCDYPSVTATKPTTAQAVCTAEGQVGAASYTIPVIAGVKYEKSSDGSTGWTTVNPGTYPVPEASSVWIRAVALEGYKLAGRDSNYQWKLNFDDVDQSKCVVPVSPTPTYATCTAPGQSSTASYSIPSDIGIQYQRWNGSQWVNVNAGTVDVSAFPANVQLQAIAKSGYTLVGGPYSWTFDFTSPGDCLRDVKPSAPSFTDSVCEADTTGSTQGGYLIPTTANVSYTVSLNGATAVPATTGVFVATDPGDVVVITAIPAAGYVLKDDVNNDIGPWTHPFADPGDCIDEVTPAAPAFTSAVCNAQPAGSYGDASYTIPSTTGVKYEVRVRNGGAWSAWSEKAADTYTVPAGARVQVRAVALSGYQLDGTSTWSVNFQVPDCLTDVVPTEPTWAPAYCSAEETVSPATFVIPEVTGLKYQELVNWSWVDRAPGSHPTTDGGPLTLRAVALAGYETTGQSVWIWWIPNIDASKDCIVPVAPTFDPQECTVPGQSSQATYTIPSDEGVRYQLWNGTSWVDIDAGTYDVDAFPATVKIQAVAKLNRHFLPGATTEWSFDFAAAGDCIDVVTATPATAVDQICVVDIDTDKGSYVSGYLVIPSTTGVDYFVDGAPVTAGNLDRGPGTYVVTAVAQTGYQLTGAAGPWELEIEAAEPCGDLVTHGTVTPVVTFTPGTCLANGSYTLGVEEAGNEEGVVWTVSGGLPNTLGTHSVTTTGTVTVTAVPAPGWGFNGPPAPPREYSFEFAAPTGDCLPTLALTGAAGGMIAGWLGLGAVLTIAGVLLVAARKREGLTSER